VRSTRRVRLATTSDCDGLASAAPLAPYSFRPDQKSSCSFAASASSSGPTTSVGRCPDSNTSRRGRSSVGFSSWAPICAFRPFFALAVDDAADARRPSLRKPLPCSLTTAPSEPTRIEPKGWSPASREIECGSSRLEHNLVSSAGDFVYDPAIAPTPLQGEAEPSLLTPISRTDRNEQQSVMRLSGLNSLHIRSGSRLRRSKIFPLVSSWPLS
jgi:hypothetical protein